MATHADLAVPSERAEFTIDKTLPNGVFLLRKTSDTSNSGERFLGCRLPNERTKIAQLEERGAGKSLLNLLNHENLVNLHTTLVHQPVGGTGTIPESLVVWDYCDAGSLADLFADSPVAPDEGINGRGERGYLPESLIWHVALGVLRALQWLHEGVRDTYTVKGPTFQSTSSSKRASYRSRCEKVRGTTSPEVDWWPILHRDIRPENILFQHPRGVETYGLVKLGNFGKAHVSGIVNMGRSPVAAMSSPENDVDIATLKERVRRWKGHPISLAVHERPYTPGSELFALGAILFRMMTGQVLPSPDRCTDCDDCLHISWERPRPPAEDELYEVPPADGENEGHAEQIVEQAQIEERSPPASKPCPHNCVHPTVNIFSAMDSLKASYTHGLKQAVVDMLDAHRSMSKFLTGRMLEARWGDYLWWCKNTLDGKRHRDLFDDLWAREVHAGWGVVEKVRRDIGEEAWEEAGEMTRERERTERRQARKRKAAAAAATTATGDEGEEEEEGEGEEEGKEQEESTSEEEEEWDGSTVRLTGRGLEMMYFQSESELDDEGEGGL